MKKKKLDIVYEDKYMIVINKPANLLMIAKDNGFGVNLYHEVSDYVKKQYPKNKIFIVHRLDRETRGLVIFAKDEKTKRYLQDHWSQVKRKYYAVVSGKVVNKNGHLENYLQENAQMKVYISNKGQLAITDYKVLETNQKNTLLDVEIKTGRKNQIRVQLANIGHHIVGDNKYGVKQSGDLALQSYYLEFKHPVTKEKMIVEKELDKYLEQLVHP